MKIFCKIFPEETIREKIKHLEHLDISLFIEDTPKTKEDLSEINILVFQEPNGYFGLGDWAIQNKQLFSLILTWDQKVLHHCENAMLMPFGHTWFKPDQYEKDHEKKFEVAHLCGKLLKTYGQSMRHEILARKNEVTGIPTRFFDVYGDRHNIEDARKGKEEVFGNSQYGIAIENFSHQGYFSEKILDLFLLKSVPIYWGCSNLHEFGFDKRGIIEIKNVDQMITVMNNLTPKLYEDLYKPYIEHNYQQALKYVNYEQNMVDKLTEVLTLNKIL